MNIHTLAEIPKFLFTLWREMKEDGTSLDFLHLGHKSISFSTILSLFFRFFSGAIVTICT